MNNTAILVKPNDNEFIAIIDDIDKFINKVKQIDYNNIGLNKDRNTIWNSAYKMIKTLENTIDDIDIYNKCDVQFTENYDGDGLLLISIFGDDGIVEFGIITSNNLDNSIDGLKINKQYR